MITIWYLLYCPAGKEEEILRSCRQRLPKDVLDEAFLFTYDCMKRYQGAWHTERRPMFPGYIFLQSSQEGLLKEALGQYHQAVMVMEDREVLFRVYPEEEAFLKSLCRRDHHMEMSRGVIRDGVTCVTEGPLKGRENLIRHIDRHKRQASIETCLVHRPREVRAGLEITDKS